MEKSASPIPQGKYVPAARFENLIFTAGMTPRVNGVLLMTGKVSAGKPIETYQEAVRQAACNALTAAENQLRPGEQISRLLSVTVFVNGEEGFQVHSKLADFASGFFCEKLGENGAAARAAVGVASLPGEAPVEVQIVAAVGKTV